MDGPSADYLPWLMLSLVSTRSPRFLGCFPALACAVALGVPPWFRTSHFPFNFMRFLSAHFSGLSRSLWMATNRSVLSAASPSSVPSADLLRPEAVLTLGLCPPTALCCTLHYPLGLEFSFQSTSLLICPIPQHLLCMDLKENSA